MKQKYIFNKVALKPDVYERVKNVEYSENPFRHNRKDVGQIRRYRNGDWITNMIIIV